MKDLWQKALNFIGFYIEEEVEGEDREIEETFDIDEKAFNTRKIRKSKREERKNNLRSIVSPQSEVNFIEPRIFNDAQKIADKFRKNIPTIINLQKTKKEDSKRIIDFVSGLVYGLDGMITPIASKVFLLTPKNVQIKPEEKRRLQEKFFNQY
ncbi:MAG: cell division protein SepF [Actinomycetia bacterium]|nr:cell division protein SepF [Actinomycetes bacterium]